MSKQKGLIEEDEEQRLNAAFTREFMRLSSPGAPRNSLATREANDSPLIKEYRERCISTYFSLRGKSPDTDPRWVVIDGNTVVEQTPDLDSAQKLQENREPRPLIFYMVD